MLPNLSRKHHHKPPLPFDRLLLLTLMAIVAMGLLMVASASIVISERDYQQSFHFLYRQLIHFSVGLVAAYFVVQTSLETWEKIGLPLLGLALLLLIIVLLPGIGHQVHGSVRWLGVGPLRLQVSEYVKFAVVVYLAGYLVRHNDALQTHLTGFIKPMGILGMIALLLLCEPDFGATAVILSTSLGMIFLAGVRLRYFIVLIVSVVSALSLIAVSAPYRLVRLTTFLNPWANQFDSGYQLTQSLIAFGRGGWTGVGLGKSVQKLFYLPEAHTDFLFAVLAEELGIIGALTVITLFVVLVARALFIGRKAQQHGKHFAGFLAYGFSLWLGMQFVINIGVNAGLLPTKGLTLPLMSYGGSSIVINCIAIALLLRIDYENRMISVGLR